MPDPQGPPKAPERVWDELLRDESPVERNRALAVRWFRQVWNERRTETTHGVHGPIRGTPQTWTPLMVGGNQPGYP